MKIWAGLFLGLAVSAVSATAAAEFSGAVYGGYGLPPKDAGDDHLRLGYGARAGWAFPIIPIYIGAAATLHTGSKGDYALAQRNYLGYYGLEGGADITFGPVGIRPYAMVGLANVHSDQNSKDKSFLAPYYGLGVMPTWRFLDLPGADFFLGLDIRFIHILKPLRQLSSEKMLTGFPIYLNIGVRI